jgi:hypothetical protein
MEFFTSYFNTEQLGDIKVISSIEKDGYSTWEEHAIKIHPRNWIDRLNKMDVSDLAIYYGMYETKALACCEQKTQRYCGNEDVSKKPHMMDAEEPVMKKCKN